MEGKFRYFSGDDFDSPANPESDLTTDGTFHDVSEAIEATEENVYSVTSGTPAAPTIESDLIRIMAVSDKFYGNQFDEAFEMCENDAKTSLYFCLATGVFKFLRAWMTLEKPEVDNAIDALKNTIEMSGRLKKAGSFADMLRKPNYDDFTDEEIHAELAYAEAVYMLSALTFIQDQNIMSLVKAGIRFRSGYQCYKNCYDILGLRTKWTSEISRREYESGVRAGNGIYNLCLSVAPPRALKLLEFVGFSGERDFGLDEMTKASDLSGTLRSSYVISFLLGYFFYCEILLGWGQTDLKYCKEMLEKQVARYPESVFSWYFTAKLTQIEGKPQEAIEGFRKAIGVQKEWKQLHNACYWEMMWSYGMQCEWDEGAKYADIMRKDSQWSPCVFTYMYAAFLYMKMEEDPEIDLKDEISAALKEVPGLKRRYAGKSTPREKFVCAKTELYFKNEFFYIWNLFSVINGSPTLLNPILDRIERKLREHVDDKNSEETPLDSYCLLLLLKGVCLRYLGYPLQAEEIFVEILTLTKRIASDTYISPHACLELGFTFLTQNKHEEADIWLRKSMKDYTKYPAELVVHLRAHFALKFLKRNSKAL